MVKASELIAEALEISGKSRTDLAAELGVSKSEITARLRGERNITVRTLAATLHALGSHLNLSLTGASSPSGHEIVRSEWSRRTARQVTNRVPRTRACDHSVTSVSAYRKQKAS
ncbi:helix-turn-helix domain-containing protein [Clavibacter michiganensis]|uniref:helix-turn-helix domain-containing protein n=2 Tax=Clavibacter TaxID=1573 RepID=UPI00188D80FA|nr:helix-turn-helix transcriptional regulator [Clavibacter sp. VKM Ac-2542]